MDANPITRADENIILAWARRCAPAIQEDVAQEIRIAWLLLLPRHNPARGSRRTYLNCVARSVVRATWRRAGSLGRAAHRTQSGDIEGGNTGETLWDSIADDAHRRRLTLARGAEADVAQKAPIDIGALLASLSPELRAVASGIMAGDSLRAIASRQGVAVSTVHDRLKKIRHHSRTLRIVRPI